MYIINIAEDTVLNSEGFRLIAETHYRRHPTVKKVELWSKGERDENGKLTRHNLFYIFYHDKSIQRVTWDNFNPKYYRAAISVSYDGKYLFLPDYEKGIVAIEITTNSVFAHYSKLKHIFSIWVTDTSLLCLHKENNRVLTRLNYRTDKVEETKKSNGLYIIPLTENCILYKKDFEHYVVARSDNLSVNMEITICEWFGMNDNNINISRANLTPTHIEAEYFYTDETDSRNILHGSKSLPCSYELRNFINDIAQ